MILGEVHLMSVCQINDLLKKFRDNRFTAGVDRVVPITTDDSTYRKKVFFFFTTVVVQLTSALKRLVPLQIETKLSITRCNVCNTKLILKTEFFENLIELPTNYHRHSQSSLVLINWLVSLTDISKKKFVLCVSIPSC